MGLLLVLVGFLHLYYNWSVITAYLKSKARQLKVFTLNFNIALVLTLLVGMGTYFQIPPLSTILTVGGAIKDAASIKYGEPPYGHAELSSLKMFAKKVDLDLGISIDLLHQADIHFTSDKQTILAIATENNLTPKQLFEIMQPATQTQSIPEHAAFPDSPPPGFGRKTLAEISTEFNLNLPDLLQALSQRGLQVKQTQSIKEIAADNDMEPMALFEIIRDIVNAS